MINLSKEIYLTAEGFCLVTRNDFYSMFAGREEGCPCMLFGDCCLDGESLRAQYEMYGVYDGIEILTGNKLGRRLVSVEVASKQENLLLDYAENFSVELRLLSDFESVFKLLDSLCQQTILPTETACPDHHPTVTTSFFV